MGRDWPGPAGPNLNIAAEVMSPSDMPARNPPIANSPPKLSGSGIEGGDPDLLYPIRLARVGGPCR